MKTTQPGPLRGITFPLSVLISRINREEKEESGEKLLARLKRFISSFIPGRLSAHSLRLAVLLLGDEKWGQWRNSWKQAPNQILPFQISPEDPLWAPTELEIYASIYILYHSFFSLTIIWMLEVCLEGRDNA